MSSTCGSLACGGSVASAMFSLPLTHTKPRLPLGTRPDDVTARARLERHSQLESPSRAHSCDMVGQGRATRGEYQFFPTPLRIPAII